MVEKEENSEMKKIFTTIFGAFIFCVIISVSVVADGPSVEQFKDGDVVCTLGDSITHGGAYRTYLELFYCTRFPERNFTLINCGICADTAKDALRRLNWDMLVHKPSVATIMLGMNDVGVGLYGKNKSDDKYVKQRDERRERHFASMRKIVETLKQAGCRIIIITPSIFDDTAELGSEKCEGANAALGVFAENDRHLAEELHTELVDFYTPMCRINAERQKENHEYTLVGKDRVHPGLVGHFVMAYQFLKAQGMPEYVSRIVLDAKTGKAGELVNCELSEIKSNEQGISFVCQEKSLVFPLRVEVEPALELVPFMQEMNRQILLVSGLDTGIYELKIDEVKVGEYQSDDLSKGIDLASNKKTAQYLQAKKIEDLIWKKSEFTVRLRDIAAAEHLFRERKDGDPYDFASNKQFFEDLLEQNKTYNIRSRLAKAYLTQKPKEEEILLQIKNIEKELITLKHIPSHIFTITKTK